jgi:hypothetical protein
VACEVGRGADGERAWAELEKREFHRDNRKFRTSLMKDQNSQTSMTWTGNVLSVDPLYIPVLK